MIIKITKSEYSIEVRETNEQTKKLCNITHEAKK